MQAMTPMTIPAIAPPLSPPDDGLGVGVDGELPPAAPLEADEVVVYVGVVDGPGDDGFLLVVVPLTIHTPFSAAQQSVPLWSPGLLHPQQKDMSSHCVTG